MKEQQKAPDREKLLLLADKIDNTELPMVSSIEAKNAIKETKELLLKVGIYLRKKSNQF